MSFRGLLEISSARHHLPKISSPKVKPVPPAPRWPDPALKTMPASGQTGLEVSRVSTAKRRLATLTRRVQFGALLGKDFRDRSVPRGPGQDPKIDYSHRCLDERVGPPPYNAAIAGQAQPGKAQQWPVPVPVLIPPTPTPAHRRDKPSPARFPKPAMARTASAGSHPARDDGPGPAPRQTPARQGCRRAG